MNNYAFYKGMTSVAYVGTRTSVLDLRRTSYMSNWDACRGASPRLSKVNANNGDGLLLTQHTSTIFEKRAVLAEFTSYYGTELARSYRLSKYYLIT